MDARQLGPWTLHECLGAGSNGRVYRASRLGYEGFFGLKVAWDDGTGVAVDDLAWEAHWLSLVDHPRVVKALEFVEDEHWAALEMVWVPGHNLRVQLAAGRPSLAQAFRWLDDLLEGLSAVHAAGQGRALLHRDLKPANLVVGVDGRLTLVDFGMAWLADGRRPCGEGFAAGSPPYISPEQMQCQPLDARSDLFIVGVVAYELLAGQPYVPLGRPATETMLEVISARLAGRRGPIVERLAGAGLPPTATEEVLSWLGGLLAPSPADRHADADAALRRLRRLRGYLAPGLRAQLDAVDRANTRPPTEPAGWGERGA